MGKISENTSLKISDFIFRFRESSQRFVVEILTQNFAFNLSGTLFFIGLGCSLKWWYKDQLLITLLKQNLPAFSQPQQKICWETGQYLIEEQTRQFIRKKSNPYTFLQSFSPSLMCNHATSRILPLSYVSPNSETESSFTPQMRNLSVPFSTQPSSISADVLLPASISQGVHSVFPCSFNESIDRLDVYSNSVVINFRSPWQKHAYHRFVGIFPELICDDTALLQSKDGTKVADQPLQKDEANRIRSGTLNVKRLPYISSAPPSVLNGVHATATKFVQSKYTFWGPPKNWFKLSARGLCVLSDNPEYNWFSHFGIHSIFSDVSLHAPLVQVHRASAPSFIQGLSPSDTELSKSSILNKGRAELRVIVNKRFFVDGIKFPTTKANIKDNFTTSLDSSKVVNQRLNKQTTRFSYPLELTQKMNGWQPPVEKLIINSYLDEIPYKLENTLWATTRQLALCTESTEGNICSTPTVYTNSKNKMEPGIASKRDNTVRNRGTIDIFAERIESNSQEKMKEDFASSYTLLPSQMVTEGIASKMDNTMLRKEKMEENLLPPSTMEEKTDNNNYSLGEHSGEGLSKNISKGAKGSLSPLIKEKSQLIGIKQLLKNELQLLVNSLPVIFVDQSCRSESNNQTNNVQSNIRGAQKRGTWLTPNRRELDDFNSPSLATFNAKQISSLNLQEKMKDHGSDMKESTISPLRYAISGSQTKGNICCTPSVYAQPDVSLHAHAPSVQMQVNRSMQAEEMHLVDSFSLLNNLGITFNNLSYLKEPPVLLPTNYDASFWKWNSMAGALNASKMPFANAQKSHPQRWQKKVQMQVSAFSLQKWMARRNFNHLEFKGLNSLTRQDNNLVTDTTFHFDPNTMTWRILQQLNCGQSLKNATTSIEKAHVLAPSSISSDVSLHAPLVQVQVRQQNEKMMRDKKPVAPGTYDISDLTSATIRTQKPVQSPKQVRFINQIILKQRHLDSLAPSFWTDQVSKMLPVHRHYNLFNICKANANLAIAKKPNGDAMHLLPSSMVSKNMPEQIYPALHSPIYRSLNPLTEGANPSFMSLFANASKDLFAKQMESNGDALMHHRCIKKMQEQIYPLHFFTESGAQQESELLMAVAGAHVHTHAPSVQMQVQMSASLHGATKIDNINPIDTQISLTNKRVRLMSGYIYPDTQSVSLMPNLYRWTNSTFPFNGTSETDGKTFRKPQFLKKAIFDASINGDKASEMTSIHDWLLYSKMFGEINRSVDRACLFKMCTSGAPITIGRLSSPIDLSSISTLAPSSIFSFCSTRCTDGAKVYANAIEKWNFEYHLGYYPGFAPQKFIRSINQIAQGNLESDIYTNLSRTPSEMHGVALNSKKANRVDGRKEKDAQNKKDIFAKQIDSTIYDGKSELDIFAKQIGFRKKTEPQLFDCSPRKTAYNGIVVQRSPFTKDFQFAKKRLERNSILGTSLFGPENPFTDRQSHFFGQRRLSTVDVNMFQRDYLRQLGKETLLQSNPKGFTYGASVERVKILSFSKAINSFLSKKRKYTYLLEEKDQWHLLFQEQLRTALEDTRKYPLLTPEESKDHGPGRIKISAPLMMARFPKKSNSYKVLAHYNDIFALRSPHHFVSCTPGHHQRWKKMHQQIGFRRKNSQEIFAKQIESVQNCGFKKEASTTDLPRQRDLYSPIDILFAPRIFQMAPLVEPSVYAPHLSPFSETWSESSNSAPLLDKGSFSFGNNKLSTLVGQQWLTQEPVNANSWLIISQWSFLVALLFWIEQTFLADIFPALFALEQLLLGTTGMKSDDRTHVTRVSKGEVPKFKDIAGIDGLLGELAEFVLFLRGHKKRLWNKRSAFGVLLTGPPGTGKTFLVRALANEAKVPVLILSAGVLTANKTNNSKPSWSIRHAFRRAKQLAPCILFIDEIDALGRSRGNIVTDINEIRAEVPGGQNVQATPPPVLLNSNFFEMKESAPYRANISLQQQLLSATETRVHQIHSTSSLREGEKQGKSISAYNQIDRYSLCADTNWLINASPFSAFSYTPSKMEAGVLHNSFSQSSAKQGAETKVPNIGNKRKFGPLTQLLVSMDGVSSLSGVLIIGATNRPESLDPALTRPGRFERIIRVEKPAEQKRIEILKLYSRNLGIQKPIPWSYLANRTMGLTAADLAVAMNYSSLKAILQGTMHTIETIEYGLDSIARFSNREVKQRRSVVNNKSTGYIRFVVPTVSASSYTEGVLQQPTANRSIKSIALKMDKTSKQIDQSSCLMDSTPDAPTPSVYKMQATNGPTTLYASAYKPSKIEESALPPSTMEEENGRKRKYASVEELMQCNEKVNNAPFFPYSLDVAFLATCKKQRLAKSLNFLITSSIDICCTPSVYAQPDVSLHAHAPLVQMQVYAHRNTEGVKAQWIYNGCIQGPYNQSGEVFRRKMMRLQRLTQIAYYQSGKIVVQTLLPLHPPVTLITLNLSGMTTATSADTYIPIDGELSTYWCSFLESRLMGLYGGKASSLLLNRQHLLSCATPSVYTSDKPISSKEPKPACTPASIFFFTCKARRPAVTICDGSSVYVKQDNTKDGISAVLHSDKPSNNYRLSRSSKRFTRFAINPLNRPKIHFTGVVPPSDVSLHAHAHAPSVQMQMQVPAGTSSKTSKIEESGRERYTESFVALHHKQRLSFYKKPSHPTENRGNLFQSNIGTEEIQTATFLATAMVNRWALSYSYTLHTFAPQVHRVSADSIRIHRRCTANTSLNLLNQENKNSPAQKKLMNKIGDYTKPENKKRSVEVPSACLCTKDTNLMNNLFSTFGAQYELNNQANAKQRTCIVSTLKRTPLGIASKMDKTSTHTSAVLLNESKIVDAMRRRRKEEGIFASLYLQYLHLRCNNLRWAEALNYTHFISNATLSSSPRRVSIENVAITVPLRTHVFQLFSPLQFSISQRDRFYPGWYRLYLPDIEATEFIKNVANYYYSKGMADVIRFRAEPMHVRVGYTFGVCASSMSIIDRIGAVNRENPLFLVSSFSKKKERQQRSICETNRIMAVAQAYVTSSMSQMPAHGVADEKMSIIKQASFDTRSASRRKKTKKPTSSELMKCTSTFQKLSSNYNDMFLLEKELTYHSLVNNCFSKAFFLIDQNRQLTDYFADYLVRFQILRQHQILYLFSTVLFSCKKQT